MSVVCVSFSEKLDQTAVKGEQVEKTQQKSETKS